MEELDIVVHSVHGMGGESENDHVDMIEGIQKKLEKYYKRDVNIISAPITYYEEMEKYQQELMTRMGNIGMKKIRNLMIAGFGDVGSIGFDSDLYKETMLHFTEVMKDTAARVAPGTPRIVIMKSFGCKMFNCFIWDENKAGRFYPEIKAFYTVGNNMAMFTSGVDPKKIIPIERPCFEFFWKNYWSKKDPLGYPMKSISQSYSYLVEDIKVRSWLYLKDHTTYDKRKSIHKEIAKDIKKILEREEMLKGIRF